MRNLEKTRPLMVATTAFLSLLLTAAVAQAQEPVEEDYGYGFYRTIEGEALVTGLEENAEPLEVERNHPLLTGDRLWVAERSRVEVVFPDRSILRLGEATEVHFEALAGSADSDPDAATTLRLLEGKIQLAGDGAVLSAEPTRVDTSNSSIYLQIPGLYRLTSDGRGWTEVVVREGFAEVETERGSAVARSGESVEVRGDYRPDVSVATAGRMDELEYWGSDLADHRRADNRYVDESLAYAAAPLDNSGYWVSVSGRHAWRPSVRIGWRPFTDGWWTYTPSGLSWVAYEPWGWITSHYGAWDYVSGYGWLWFPGTVYSPAWVYWYWGPTHTAWIPSGYYSRFYGPRFGYGFRYGVYGWAGGYWDSWSYWTFCPTRYFGHRGYRSYWRSGHDMHRDRRLRAVPRGVITNDTRDLTPGRWGKPTEIVAALERRHGGRAGVTRSLGDVSSFIERRAELPETTKQMVLSDRAIRSGGSSMSGRSRSAGASHSDVITSPWRVDRPQGMESSRGRAAGIGSRAAGRTATDWDLIERVRRFENKQEGVATSPRSMSRSDSAASPRLRESGARSQVPRQRILDRVGPGDSDRGYRAPSSSSGRSMGGRSPEAEPGTEQPRQRILDRPGPDEAASGYRGPASSYGRSTRQPTSSSGSSTAAPGAERPTHRILDRVRSGQPRGYRPPSSTSNRQPSTGSSSMRRPSTSSAPRSQSPSVSSGGSRSSGRTSIGSGSRSSGSRSMRPSSGGSSRSKSSGKSSRSTARTQGG